MRFTSTGLAGDASCRAELVLQNNLFVGNSGYSTGGALIGSLDGATVTTSANSFVANQGTFSSALQFNAITTADHIVNTNLFAWDGAIPAITCNGAVQIARNNVFSASAASLGGACTFGN